MRGDPAPPSSGRRAGHGTPLRRGAAQRRTGAPLLPRRVADRRRSQKAPLRMHTVIVFVAVELACGAGGARGGVWGVRGEAPGVRVAQHRLKVSIRSAQVGFGMPHITA